MFRGLILKDARKKFYHDDQNKEALVARLTFYVNFFKRESLAFLGF